jgi:hypothetical protein
MSPKSDPLLEFVRSRAAHRITIFKHFIPIPYLWAGSTQVTETLGFGICSKVRV